MCSLPSTQVCWRPSRTGRSGTGYAERYSAALERVDRGERAWVAQPRIDSCHTVWMELHDDLLATLGLKRGS
jgi:hypothetical protein